MALISRIKIVRQLWSSLAGGASRSPGQHVRGFCAASLGRIKVNNIPEWAPAPKANAVNKNEFPLPYRDCTILTVLDSQDMSGRADCRQGVCRKCAVNVKTGEDGEVFEVLSCQEIATDGLVVDLPDGWQAKPRWSDPHPEKVRVTTRELKATTRGNSSASLGKRLKNMVRVGNYAFKQNRWADCMKSMDDIDTAIAKYGFSSYVEFQYCSTLARDIIPDFLVALSMSPKVTFFLDKEIPQELADKAADLAGHMRAHLEEAGTSASAFDADMDENTIGSHGVGKKGAQSEGFDGGFAALESGAFYRNFSVWPEFAGGESAQEHIEDINVPKGHIASS